MRVKVCGMKYPENIQRIASFEPDYLGFIFYNKSLRFVNSDVVKDHIINIPKQIQKVGVFVNEDLKNITQICQSHQISIVQLHGNETPEFCINLMQEGKKVIKAFGVDRSYRTCWGD